MRRKPLSRDTQVLDQIQLLQNSLKFEFPYGWKRLRIQAAEYHGKHSP